MSDELLEPWRVGLAGNRAVGVREAPGETESETPLECRRRGAVAVVAARNDSLRSRGEKPEPESEAASFGEVEPEPAVVLVQN